MRFYDLDLPDVIEIKRRFFEETDRYHFIPSSVLDYDWMAPLLQTGWSVSQNPPRVFSGTSIERM